MKRTDKRAKRQTDYRTAKQIKFADRDRCTSDNLKTGLKSDPRNLKRS